MLTIEDVSPPTSVEAVDVSQYVFVTFYVGLSGNVQEGDTLNVVNGNESNTEVVYVDHQQDSEGNPTGPDGSPYFLLSVSRATPEVGAHSVTITNTRTGDSTTLQYQVTAGSPSNPAGDGQLPISYFAGPTKEPLPVGPPFKEMIGITLAGFDLRENACVQLVDIAGLGDIPDKSDDDYVLEGIDGSFSRPSQYKHSEWDVELYLDGTVMEDGSRPVDTSYQRNLSRIKKAVQMATRGQFAVQVTRVDGTWWRNFGKVLSKVSFTTENNDVAEMRMKMTVRFNNPVWTCINEGFNVTWDANDGTLPLVNLGDMDAPITDGVLTINGDLLLEDLSNGSWIRSTGGPASFQLNCDPYYAAFAPSWVVWGGSVGPFKLGGNGVPTIRVTGGGSVDFSFSRKSLTAI